VNTTFALILAAVGAIGAGFMAGWVLGWGNGKAQYAATVAEQNERLKQLAEEIDILSRALQMHTAPDPTLADLRVRVPEDAA